MDSSSPPSSLLSLGIDTGGTYTDAVLYSEKDGIVAKAKALTTRHDLAIGIAEAADRVLAEADAEPGRIGLVSMSTTLATNALVEGQGGRVGLVMVGFSEKDLDRDGLRTALRTDPVVFLPGGHDVHGNETPLATDALEAALPELAKSVTAFAVCAYFAVRNPAHERAVVALLREATGLPVTASHELSSELGGPRRALTTLLNARLIGLIDRLIAATQGFLQDRSIESPLMVVRGDGALVSAAFARLRPIETILSGPAASLVGARHLTGLDRAVVSDIGGTTTDIAVLENGRPRIDPEGATVGGFRTMVEAVSMRTFGLGGDSEVALKEGTLDFPILLGPRRLVPLALAARLHGGIVAKELERQLLSPVPSRLDGRLAWRTGLPERFAAGLTRSETKLYAELAETPVALDRLLASNAQMVVLNKLVARGLVHLCGFTPSDAAHVLGLQENWDAETARLGARLLARRRSGRGEAIAASAEDVSRRVLERLTRRSAQAILESTLVEDGLDGAATVAHPLVTRCFDEADGITRLRFALDRPVIGLGASAAIHYAGLDRFLGCECVVHGDSDVANALGAVVGHVRIAVRAVVMQPSKGVFRANVEIGPQDFDTEEEAIAFTEKVIAQSARKRAYEAGADAADIEMLRDIRTAVVQDKRTFVEATLTAVASGRPRVVRE